MRTSATSKTRSPSPSRGVRRRGAVIVLTAFFIVGLLGILALAIDMGYIATVSTELKRAADASALAGAGHLVDGTTAATAAVGDMIGRNKVGAHFLGASDVAVETGNWDPDTRTFTAGGTNPSAIKVKVDNRDQPLFFGRVFGNNDFDTHAESVARYQPRDIVIVLDYSASMSDDSERP